MSSREITAEKQHPHTVDAAWHCRQDVVSAPPGRRMAMALQASRWHGCELLSEYTASLILPGAGIHIEYLQYARLRALEPVEHHVAGAVVAQQANRQSG